MRDDNAFDFISPFRSGGAAFSGKTITPVAVGVLVLSLATKNETLQEGLFGCVTAYGASSIVRTFVVYPIVARTRPEPRVPDVVAPPATEGDQYKFAIPGSSDWGKHSLPGRAHRERRGLRGVPDKPVFDGRGGTGHLGHGRRNWTRPHARPRPLDIRPADRRRVRLCGGTTGCAALEATRRTSNVARIGRLGAVHQPTSRWDEARLESPVLAIARRVCFAERQKFQASDLPL